MATSSIFTNFNITDPQKAEAFVKALVQSEEDKKNRKEETPNCRYVTDPEEIKAMFGKWKESNSK